METENSGISKVMLQVAEKAEGLSGRALRKLPFLAHAYCLQVCAEARVIWII